MPDRTARKCARLVEPNDDFLVVIPDGPAIAINDRRECRTGRNAGLDVDAPNDANMLNEIELASRLNEADRTALAGLACTIDFDARETIFREGERHPFVYWLVEGQVSLEMASSGKSMRSLVTLAAGDLLGWSALLTGRRMTATAKTIQPTRLLRFETEALLELSEAHHEIGYRVMQDMAGQLAQRLLATRLQMLDLFQHPAASSGEACPSGEAGP